VVRTDIPAGSSARFYAAYFGVLGLVLPFLGPYLEWRGVGAVGVGLITAGFSLTRVVYTPFLGLRVDGGWWRKRLLTFHLVVAVGAGLALVCLEAPAAIGVAVVVVGLGYGTVLPLVEAAILDRLPATGYGSLRLWGSIGFIAASLGAGQVLSRVGDHLFPWALASALLLLLATVRPLEEAARPAHGAGGGRLGGAVWCLLALLTLHQVAHGPYYAFFSIHLHAAGLGSGAVSAAWALGVLAELLAFRRSQWLERRLGLRRMLVAALVLSPVRWMLLALPVGTASLVVAQLGHAVTFALVHLAGIQLVQRAVGAGSLRHAQSLYSGLTFGLGAVAGAAAAGPLYARWGGQGSFAVAAALSLAVAVAAVPVVGRVRELSAVSDQLSASPPRPSASQGRPARSTPSEASDHAGGKGGGADS